MLFLSRGAGGGELGAERAEQCTSHARYTDTATQTEEGSKLNPGAEANWLFYRSPR